MYCITIQTQTQKLCLFSPLPISHLLHNSVQAQWITALLSVSSCLGPSVEVNIFHQCLHVRSWSFSGTCGFLAGLFTFLSRQLIVNRLIVIANYKRDWFRTIIMTTEEKKQNKFYVFTFTTLCRAVKWSWSPIHNTMMNEQWETSTVAGNWCGQWTTTDLIWCCPPWQHWMMF